MTGRSPAGDVEGLVFDVDTFAVHDGAGIRMAVYLKGCPLRCAWCHSPESQAARPEVIHLADRCTYCGACEAACASGVHDVAAGAHTMARECCVACGACVAACPAGALAVRGRTVCASEIVARAVRMRPFFNHSGGGVTLTGGEPTAQPAFAATVLDRCRDEHIHTAVETCGACAWADLEALADRADLVLYDLKLIDDAEHRRLTGSSNAAALANLSRLAGRGQAVEVRMPLIPGMTDTQANLGGIFDFVRAAGLRRVALLPYNVSAPAKYEWLGRAFALDAEPQDERRLADILAAARAAGLDAELVL